MRRSRIEIARSGGGHFGNEDDWAAGEAVDPHAQIVVNSEQESVRNLQEHGAVLLNARAGALGSRGGAANVQVCADWGGHFRGPVVSSRECQSAKVRSEGPVIDCSGNRDEPLLGAGGRVHNRNGGAVSAREIPVGLGATDSRGRNHGRKNTFAKRRCHHTKFSSKCFPLTFIFFLLFFRASTVSVRASPLS